MSSCSDLYISLSATHLWVGKSRSYKTLDAVAWWSPYVPLMVICIDQYMLEIYLNVLYCDGACLCTYRGADKSLARPTSQCILFDV